MAATEVIDDPAAPAARTRLRPSAEQLWAVPGLIAVGLMLVWAVHDGGYDADTWYWGALIMLGLLAAVVIARGFDAIRLSRTALVSLAAFALYVAWSYLSIAWAKSPGDALTGSNRALLYLLVFSTMLVLPWTVRGALIALLAFTLGVGVIAIVLLVRLASADHVQALLIARRLTAPTGYFNSTAALFTIQALIATVLATRRELPGLLRGLLIALACAGIQLAVIVQSRGWLFTLPLILIAAIVLLPDRLRVGAAAVIPAAITLAGVHRLLRVYDASASAALNHAAMRAGHSALLLCGLAFFVGTLIAWGESLLPAPRPSALRRRVLGSLAMILALGAVIAGGLAVSHGHPLRFVSRQWHGFSHPSAVRSGSHFTDVGSGRYDFWRVSLDAVAAHPIGGLGQDNFGEYYVSRRRTGEEPAWTHSLELRLLTHTGVVGTALFTVFLVAAIAAALRARRRRGLEAAVLASALLPLVVWLIHGSVDWFWEVPALTGPALGFLGVAGAVGLRSPPGERVAPVARQGVGAGRRLTALAGGLAMIAAVIVLAFPYLSVREVSLAADVSRSNPAQALGDLKTGAELNPLSADPDRLAGAIALSNGRFGIAADRFQRATARDPGGWFAWLGAGLAASARGDKALARHDLRLAASINPRQSVVQIALRQLDGPHPLTPAAAIQMLASAL
jgi:hypothetical protein